ncbi:MAG TPA: glycoside hydrolase family 15 protein [Jatrophihabitans sp.]|nr:glycoside hydrolase family 15 protein [Jatrophihabitans sp.]
MTEGYPPIAEHGLIGDLQTAALVTTDGSVDWFCAPRFDSPSIFGALLDAERGGRFRIRPAGARYEAKQMYLPETAILLTRFLTEDGVGEMADFMPIEDRSATERHRLVRMIRCVRGRMSFEVELAPRFDYGRAEHRVELFDAGAVFASNGTRATAHVVRASEDERLGRARVVGEDLHATLDLTMGQVRGIVFETGHPGPPAEISPADIQRSYDATVEFWKAWTGKARYAGRWRETLLRSAITLKLMTYAPTGGIVAAPTMGLPEQVGGERNWDYRYTWVRDASFSVYALLRMGYLDEAAAFSRWLGARVREHAGRDSGPLQIMYRVDGGTDLKEEVLGHWAGYRDSFPARVGNDAAGQLQLDIYGEAVDSIYLGDEHGLQAGHAGWLAVRDVLDWLCEHWDQAEEGIWETRGGRRDFTYGRLMSWVALDRGLRMAAEHGRPAPVARWLAERDRIYDQIMTRGWNRDRHAFVQHYDDTVLDSSLLRMSQVGFVTPQDPMWTSTLDAMRAELVTDSLVYRYDPAASPDGLRGSEGTFSLCTFSYVDALARAGRVDEARLVFEKMLTYANHVGLFSEEIGLTGEQLGNFPQAFTHLALIDAAMSLNSALSG